MPPFFKASALSLGMLLSQKGFHGYDEIVGEQDCNRMLQNCLLPNIEENTDSIPHRRVIEGEGST